MYRNQCGHQNPDDSKFCTSCGVRLGATSEVPQSAQPTWTQPTWIGLMIITGGAIMMHITMALDWYTVHGPTSSINLDFSSLVTERFSNLNYAGTSWPLLFIIIFSAIALMSVVYSFASGIPSITLWLWLGLLCLLALVSNFVYIFVVQISREETGYYATPHIGWIVAFFGALALFLGSACADSTVSQSNPMV